MHYHDLHIQLMKESLLEKHNCSKGLGISINMLDLATRDQQWFGLGLPSLALSKPNRLSLNRLGFSNLNQTKPIPKPVYE